MLLSKQVTKNAVIAAAIATILVAPAYAQEVQVSTLTATQMIENLAKQLPNVMRLITALAYVLGMFFIYRGVLQLKQFGMSRTMMSMEHHLTGPILMIVVGAFLLYLPTAVQIGMGTFWTDPNPYGYLKNQDQWAKFLNNIYLIVQIFGTIAFIRGLILLSRVGGRSGGQPGTFGTALAHIIGGIFCINIYQFVQVVLVTLGIQT